jgi:Domain of unknown function (DUF4258)
MKPIRLSDHARARLQCRGELASEVEDTIRTSPWEPAERGRLECRRSVPFNQEWNGMVYATKEVRPIFVDDPEEIVVVTVYVYYL